jgi:NAD(P)-dependent dehydrogenase (short-subunit alcohol dehydrogenase family)
MKYALLTGATGGLGQVIARALSGTGRWTVFAAGTNPEALEELKKLPRILPVRMDITCQDSVEAARQTVLQTAPGLDAVVNFAGLAAFSSLVEGQCVETLQKVLDVNVTGTARVNRTFFDLVLAGGGRIINCSSESGWMTPQPFSGIYAASKYAVEAYSDSLRRELMYLSIPVIKVQPGAYKTQLTQRVRDGFEAAASATGHYGKLLSNMKPLMDHELARGENPRRLVRAVLKAMEASRPRLKYRVGTGKLLFILELLPEKCVDMIYGFFYRMN